MQSRRDQSPWIPLGSPWVLEWLGQNSSEHEQTALLSIHPLSLKGTGRFIHRTLTMTAVRMGT